MIINEPNVWMINLLDKSGKHEVDPGPSLDVHLPIFPDRSVSTQLKDLEFGRELEFFTTKGAKGSEGEMINGRGTSRYELTIENSKIVLWTDVKSKKPLRVSLIEGAQIETIEYLSYDDLAFNPSLFQPLRLTLETGMMKLGRVALDGSKVKGNASKHKAMSYGRMKETEKRLREEVRKLLNQAEAADQEEDSRYGRDRRGDELPEELQRRETRIARIREAKQALEERAREQAKNKGKDPEEARPTEKAQYNFTDPESRMLKGPDGFLQGYNTQIAVEPVFQLIVGQRVTQAANDKQQMVPLVEAIEKQSGQKPEGVVADSGYCSDENLKYLAKKKLEGFVSTEKQKHGQRNQPCPRGPLPREASRVERMERKLETKVGAAVYATRKFIVEPVFGQIKQARGFRQFLLRGIEKVRGEWALICMTHNILKFHKICSG